MKEKFINFLSRFKSWALWLSIAALVVFCVKEFTGIDISNDVNEFMNYLEGHSFKSAVYKYGSLSRREMAIKRIKRSLRTLLRGK